MDTRSRLEAAWNGRSVDHIPLTTWCFGITPPPELRWKSGGADRLNWYSGRMEFLHEIPGGWSVSDEIARYRAWAQLGVDDLIDVSVPWGCDPRVGFVDSFDAPAMTRVYDTPAGILEHRVRRTGERIPPGWVIQPDVVRPIEDFNIPRGVRHIVSSPEDIDKLACVFAPPGETERRWFADRMAAFDPIPEAPLQAWVGFGVDAAVWFCGVEGALFLAIDHPEAFRRLLDVISAVDTARTELAAAHSRVDIVAMRGWYSSTDFWSPALFREFLKPDIAKVAAIAHRHGKKLAYVMTTGVDVLGEDLLDAGVDLLYFVDPSDPVSHGLDFASLRRLADGGMTLVGGISTIAVTRNDPEEIDRAVRTAVESLGPTNRFILHPVDALFPDTGWSGVTSLIESWKRYRG